MQVAKEHKLVVIEDCAQAFGATSGGKVVGSIGDTGSFSFYPTKVLGCYGDGGMVTTNSDALNEHIRRLRNHGAAKPFIHVEIGMNSRLDEVQAALLRLKLRTIKNDIAGRQQVAAGIHQTSGRFSSKNTDATEARHTCIQSLYHPRPEARRRAPSTHRRADWYLAVLSPGSALAGCL